MVVIKVVSGSHHRNGYFAAVQDRQLEAYTALSSHSAGQAGKMRQQSWQIQHMRAL